MLVKIASILAFIVLVAIGSFVYYQQTYLSIWGFNLSKQELKEVIVQTENHSYIVTDKKQVLKIAEVVSKMKKYSKIESFNFPPQNKPEPYKELLIRTDNKAIYGGNFWVMDNTVTLDSSGYYWEPDYKKLSSTLKSSLKKAAILN
ncbi:hypothetical protein [Bacillus sp. NEB1478]|uniref:hypothetical protein n=1 Tax=Bacillus sp. NEB1478 TaxID=3073816 RepID=UPI0028737AAF|nr:hypothetical protein [Bacillus sp. NEB1478]WNB90993.1 hypothetical protein RGB74_13890 [Bacillus sp. NEB1478]